MDIQHLRSFRSVVATGSVRAAADLLGYSPSAISQQVAQLQKDAGVALLARVGRGVEPTSAGRALATRIDTVLGELGDLDDFVRALRAGRVTAFTVGYFSSLGTTWLPAVVGPLVEEFPDIRFDLYVSDVHDPTRRPRPDLQLLVMPPDVPVPAGYDTHPVAEDPYVVAVREDHPLAGQVEIPLRELADHTWIDNDFDQGWCRRVTIDACAAAGFQPRFRVQTHDYPSALALVATGVGLSVMPSLGARHRPDGVVTRRVVDPTPVRSIHAVVLRESADSPVLLRALDLVHRAAESTQDLTSRATASVTS